MKPSRDAQHRDRATDAGEAVIERKGTAAPAGSGAASSVQDHPATYAAGLRCRKIRPSRRGDRRDRVGAAREMLVKAWRHASGEPGYGLDGPRVQDLFQHRLQGSIPGPETRAPAIVPLAAGPGGLTRFRF